MERTVKDDTSLRKETSATPKNENTPIPQSDATSPAASNDVTKNGTTPSTTPQARTPIATSNDGIGVAADIDGEGVEKDENKQNKDTEERREDIFVEIYMVFCDVISNFGKNGNFALICLGIGLFAIAMEIKGIEDRLADFEKKLDSYYQKSKKEEEDPQKTIKTLEGKILELRVMIDGAKQ